MGDDSTDRDSSAKAPRVDAADVQRIARAAGLPLGAEKAAEQAGLLEGFLAFADGWRDLGLAFSFEDGVFAYAPSVAQFRPEWDRPTGLNKGRVVVVEEDGSVAQRSTDGG